MNDSTTFEKYVGMLNCRIVQPNTPAINDGNFQYQQSAIKVLQFPSSPITVLSSSLLLLAPIFMKLVDQTGQAKLRSNACALFFFFLEVLSYEIWFPILLFMFVMFRPYDFVYSSPICSEDLQLPSSLITILSSSLLLLVLISRGDHRGKIKKQVGFWLLYTFVCNRCYKIWFRSSYM